MYSSSQRNRNGKIGVGQVAVNGAGTFTAEDTERLVILKAARNNWNICRIERSYRALFFCADNYEDYMYVENLDNTLYNYGILIIRTY